MNEPRLLPTDDQAPGKMDPELKAKWLEALRSGRYQQGHGALRSAAQCYCCLGVLADIRDPSLWSDKANEQPSTELPALYTYNNRCVEMLNFDLQRELGIYDVAGRLAAMNDGTDDHKRHSFAEIADYIEANL